MADNTTFTPGTGATVATDDIGGTHYQRNKITLGTDGVATADLDGTAARGAYVDPRPASVTQNQDSSGLTIATTAYTAGDVLGVGWTFTNMVRANGGIGRITSAALLDDGDITVAIDLYIASAAITFGTDNVAPSVSDTDATKIVAVIGMSMGDLGASRFGSLSGLAIPYHCDAASLFVYAVTKVGHTFFAAVDDLHLRLYVEQD